MSYTQQNRAMEVTTPLGKDKLLLVGFTGQESISRLFTFHLDMLAENSTDVALPFPQPGPTDPAPLTIATFPFRRSPIRHSPTKRQCSFRLSLFKESFNDEV